jgi:hypothetical protein
VFIRTSQFIALAERVAEAQGQASVLREQLASQKVSLDWLRTRVNQLEKERAILMRERTGLNIPIPEIVEHIGGNAMRTVVPPSMQMPSFEDIGDEAAQQLGITHNENGELDYAD